IRSGTAGPSEKAPTPALGVTLFDPSLTARLRAGGFLHDDGGLIKSVLRGGAAEAAGLQPTRRISEDEIALGGLVGAAEGKPGLDARDLIGAVSGKKVGEVVKLAIVRNEKRMDVSVTLKPRPTPPGGVSTGGRGGTP